MSQVARDAGLSRESLYKVLSGERSPGFDTILKVLDALGLKLHAEAVHADSCRSNTDMFSTYMECIHHGMRPLEWTD